jgi:NAD(P)-dependent dehydrogenase (short-subunit alcohol dehydrogenase family)
MKEKNRKAWVVFGANSVLAKNLIKILNGSNEVVFPVGRDQNIELEKLKDFDTTVVMFNGQVFFKKFQEITGADIQTQLNSNLISTVTFLQKLFKEEIAIKKVFLVGTRAGMNVGHHKYFSLYAASKFACLGLFRSLSAEFPSTFFTYYVCPSADTNIFSRGLVDNDLLLEVKSKEQTIKKTPDEIAEKIHNFLESQAENLPDLILQ